MSILLSQFIDTRSGVIWIKLSKECRIHHNPTVNGYVNRISSVHEKGIPLILLVMYSH